MAPQNRDVGTAQPLESFLPSAQRLDAAGFETEHGSGFLIVTATSVDRARAEHTQLLLGTFDQAAAGGRTADVSVVVFCLRPSIAQAGHLVTIGRDIKHDVVIPDTSVSRFHAFMRRGEDGVFVVQDMASTNGTTVNGQSAPARGAGPPTPVKPGDNLCFGQVQVTFTDARALREFVLQAAG